MRQRLLLDEMISAAVAAALRDEGHDVESITSRPDLRGLPDVAVLELAQSQQRIVVTLNIGDFARLHHEWVADERRHAGIVMVPSSAFPQNRGLVGALSNALSVAAAADVLPGPGHVLWLARP